MKHYLQHIRELYAVAEGQMKGRSHTLYMVAISCRRVMFSLLTLLLVSCNGGESQPLYRIGVSQCSGGHWRLKQNNEMLRELLLQEHATMELRCAEDDDQRQIADIQYFIDQKVDILLVSPHDAEALTEVVSKAYRKGIPVLLFDRQVNGDQYTAFVGGDNVGVGKQMAAYIATRLRGRNGKVLEIMGDMHTSPAFLRHKGLHEGLKDCPHIEVIASVDAGWMGPLAADKADSLLRLYPDVDAIVAHSDYMANEAKKAADLLAPNNHILFVGADGFGAPGIGIEAVVKGNLDATAIYPTGGDVIIQTALKILHGEQVERQLLIPSNLVSTAQEALLLINMEYALTAEVKRVERMHDRALFYLKQSRLERMLLYASLGILVLLCVLCATLYRLNRLRRASNKRLHEQQNTLRQRNEQLLTMTKELEEATNAKLVFFTNISHDFRTPLTLISAPIAEALSLLKEHKGESDAVKGESALCDAGRGKSALSDVMEMKGSGPETEGLDCGQMERLLSIAQRNVRVLLDLVNQILDFRKVENGKMKLNLQRVNIYEQMRGWHESFSSMAQLRGINLKLTVGSGEWFVHVDIRKLERMVYNLVGNSIKFTPRGGTISMECLKGDKLTIVVRDTGPGIDQEHLNHIFERFYQIGNNDSEGSGIGLALVKKYTELMGGTIDIESHTATDHAEQVGTVITLHIPLSSAEVAGKQDESHLSPDHLLACSNLFSAGEEESESASGDESLPIVLVIDDNADMRVFISSLLSSRYRVLTAVDGEQGFQVAQEQVPDIIICDVMMPVMDGLECCRHLKNTLSTSHIPVVMLTACSLDEQRVQGMECGAEAYLAKPFSSSVLLAQLKTLLQNRVRVRNYQRSLLPTSSAIPCSSAEVSSTASSTASSSAGTYSEGAFAAASSEGANSEGISAGASSAAGANSEGASAGAASSASPAASPAGSFSSGASASPAASPAAINSSAASPSASSAGAASPSASPASSADAIQQLSRYDRQFLEKMYECVESHYTEASFNVESLADMVCLSRTQLYRKCKALTGESPVEVIRNCRMEHARQLLINSYDSVADVARAVGIPDATYFTKCYKAYFGVTPSKIKI